MTPTSVRNTSYQNGEPSPTNNVIPSHPKKLRLSASHSAAMLAGSGVPVGAFDRIMVKDCALTNESIRLMCDPMRANAAESATWCATCSPPAVLMTRSDSRGVEANRSPSLTAVSRNTLFVENSR
ncbi:MAG: hypothetical protein C4326_10890 [Ignavibacteria bacterium]